MNSSQLGGLVRLLLTSRIWALGPLCPGSNIISLTDFDNRYVRHEQFQEALEQIELTPGPPGPPGPPGEIRTIEVTFATPVSVWDVAHDLDHQPEVTTTDLYGAEIKGDVRFLP